MKENSDDSLGQRLANADRTSLRAQLQRKIHELGGIMSESVHDEVPDFELEFLNRVIAWETSPVSTHRDWLARHRLRHLRRATGESRPDATTRRTDDENGAFWDETPS